MTVTAFDFRHAAGCGEESNFTHWIRRQAGWDAEPYGQALLSNETKAALRRVSFNGDSGPLERLIAEMPSYMREKYIDGIGGAVPALVRWMPDVAVIYRGCMVCTADVKTSIRETPYWSIEISSLLSSMLTAMSGVASMYVFPPSPYFDYWTCASHRMLMESYDNAFDGKSAKGGSRTPYILVRKDAVTKPFRHLMTEIETNGFAEFNGVVL
jgi:hypothetical protein